MILDEIKQRLEEVDPRVYYGMVDESVKDTVWDYIVFNRTKLKASTNRTGYTDGYDVHIIRENFVPEGVDLEIIAKMQSIDGIRLNVNEDGEYNYLQKPNTNIVVEMLTLHFVRARK
ncbi:MAG: hypothetical protein IJE92_01170 [Clostridia bacterium]|nr:hypothetical protein [Clostridia bacterium]